MIYKNKRNPILPLKYHIPDSEAHVMPDGKLYIYGSFDNRTDEYCSEEYHVASTPDMENWEIEDDISLCGKTVPWFNNPEAIKYPGIDWENPTPFIKKILESRTEENNTEETENTGDNPALLFAPDCMEKNGKYYLYFCLADDSEGVAVSDNPKGPFTDLKQFPIGGIDPAVFTDDDGQSYYYWGQLYAHGVPLNDDMISFNKELIVDNLVTEEKHFFHEGSSMRKIGDKYYFIYADMEKGRPTSLGYSIGNSPLGPFTYKGIIINNEFCDPESWNNHGSIENVNGQWYVFYHRSSRNSRIHRRLCVEKIEILTDGTIPEVKMTSQGIGEPFSPNEKIMGYQACEVHGGCYIDTDEKYGEKLTCFKFGSKAVFRYIKSNDNFSGIAVMAKGKGIISVWFDNKKVHEFTIDSTDWEKTETLFSSESGQYELSLYCEDGDNIEIAEIVFY